MMRTSSADRGMDYGGASPGGSQYRKLASLKDSQNMLNGNLPS